MAVGDVSWFDDGLTLLGNKELDLGADTIKFGLVTSVVTPTAATATPSWGAAGATNLSTNAVATGTAWTAPVALGTVTAITSGGKFVFDAADPTAIAQDAAGFTNARWLILFDDTHVSKWAFAFMDLGSDRSIVSGPLTLTFNAAGILTIEQP